jgi:hypothetical protein
MVELKEKANNYAEENVINVLKEAFAKVYADGYRDGYKDREEEIPVDLRDNKTEYVDLGLPSGTLWAKDYERVDSKLRYLPFDQAKKYSIPTMEQWEELCNKCQWVNDNGSFACVGVNGNSIYFDCTGYIKVTQQITEPRTVKYWICSDGNECKAACLSSGNQVLRNTNPFFSGFKLPIRLIRNSNL